MGRNIYESMYQHVLLGCYKHLLIIYQDTGSTGSGIRQKKGEKSLYPLGAHC